MEMCQELARHSDRIPWRPAWKDRSGNLKKTGEIRAGTTAGEQRPNPASKSGGRTLRCSGTRAGMSDTRQFRAVKCCARCMQTNPLPCLEQQDD
jgi:hypothetical protein